MRRHILHTIDPNDERGVAVVIVALSLFALFGMVVLAVDLGALVVKHRGLVNANDAAAVAAAGSFARNEAEAGANEAPAVTAADRFATDNVGDAEHDTSESWWTVTPGLSASGCLPSSCGSVKVRYQAGQSLFFAPVLGLSEEVTAHGTATGIWGPAGAAQPAPIVIHLDWLTDTDPDPDNANCAAPVPSNSAPIECAFWLGERGGDDGDDDNDGINSDDNSQWRWISLNPNGWDTPRGSSCPDVSSSDLRDWISGSDVPRVKVNPVPTPTYVCASSGNEDPADFLGALRNQIGTFKVFPVNDGQGDHAPPGQVDRDGSPCRRDDQSCTPAQYDIVGFTSLRIDAVLRGDDDEATGDPGGTFRCSPPLEHDFEVDPPGDTWNLEEQFDCPLTDLHWPNDRSRPYPRIRPENDSQPFNGGLAPDCTDVDYCYDDTTHVITWLAEESEENARVDWDYFVPPSPGKCGIHQPDDQAVCLVVSWQGYRSGGINPGGGVDFGLRAVRLSA